MSETATLARPYARAAFDAARDANALAPWSQKLAFAAQLLGDARVRAAIGDPRVTPAEVVGLLLPNGDSAESEFGQFLALLVNNRRAELLPEIDTQFEALKRDVERILKVTVRTASALPSGEEESIRAALKKRFNRDIEMEQRIEPGLIGGAIIDAGDVVIDGSVRGRLARLESALTH